MDNIIHLDEHRDGPHFCFHPFELTPDDAECPNGVGFIEGERPISVLVCAEELSGFCMTAETARRLGEELIAAAEQWTKEGVPHAAPAAR